MSSNLRRLVELIRRYKLDNRSREFRNVLRMIDRGLLDEQLAEVYVLRVQPWIDQFDRLPNLLGPVPASEECPPAPLRLGHCEENDELIVGLFLTNGAHCLCAGTTGSGKTVAIRRLLDSIEEHNRIWHS